MFSRADLPSEQAFVEFAGFRGIRSAQVGPAERAVLASDPDSLILLRLPDAERCAGWVLNDCHSAVVHHIERRGADFTTKLRGFFGGGIRILYCYVDAPVGRHSFLLGAKRAGCGSVLTLQFKDGVVIIRAHGVVFDAPAEKFHVEIFGGSLVGGGEFDPAERTGGGCDVRHWVSICLVDEGEIVKS